MSTSDGTQTAAVAGSQEPVAGAEPSASNAFSSCSSPPATGYRLPATTSPDRGNHHWLAWEIGSLLGWVTAGKDWPTISVRLERSVSACQRQLGRLVAGETPCPALYADSLAAAKVMFAPVPKPAPTPPGTATAAPGRSALSAAAIDRVNAQYRALAAANAEVREAMSEIENMLTFGLALEVVRGNVPIDVVARFIGPNWARTIAAAAAEIRDGRQPVLIADEPLVSTGQGTSEERLYPRDLVEPVAGSQEQRP